MRRWMWRLHCIFLGDEAAYKDPEARSLWNHDCGDILILQAGAFRRIAYTISIVVGTVTHHQSIIVKKMIQEQAYHMAERMDCKELD